MKLLRYGPPGQERPGLLDAAGRIRDLGDLGDLGDLSDLGGIEGIGAIDDLAGIKGIADLAGAALAPERLAALARLDPTALPEVRGPVRLGPCVGGVGKIVCVGPNYRSLATAAGLALPDAPVVFLKAPSALCGPDDPLELPPGTTMVDWEVELAVVIGRRAQRVSRAEAMDHVAGYCVINDLSARDWQFGADGVPGSGHNGGQWDLGKDHDGFAPLGPWLVTSDEIPDPGHLSLWLDVDGQTRQQAATSDWLFDLPTIIAHISRFMTLLPGDVIATGTPPGCGFLARPPSYLSPGQTLRAGIDGLGTQTRRVLAASED